MNNNNKYILLIFGIALLIVSVWLFFSRDTVIEAEDQGYNEEENDEKENAAFNEDIKGISWQWKETVYSEDEVFVPGSPEEFVLKFKDDGEVIALTDCNNMMGEYETSEEGELSFSEMLSTLMYCEGSDENDYREMLAAVEGYSLEDDRLVLILEEERGSMFFEAINQ